jgi:FkbH-like protein
LNAQRWMELAGAKNAYNPKLWYMGKISFGNEVFKHAVRDVKAAFRGVAGQARKIILLDLDETLWGGVLGDVGWDGITLGGHDPIGEAFTDFQNGLKALKNRGVLLGIVSKNDESVAIEAISRNPEMVLHLDDFAGWRINWIDKTQNILSLISELNLGLQSVVFVDDNPVERSRVRDTLPEVLVPEWPQDKQLYKKTLLELSCFDVPSITGEDVERTLLYAAQRKRVALREEGASFDDWLRTLDTRVIVESLNAPNLPRAAQLINKTNQMNLSTRRMTEAELFSWAHEKKHRLWTFRVVDKFGDAGLTGIASIEFDQEEATVVDFVLSCRVMGRRIEETMLHLVAGQAAHLGIKQIRASYIPTPRNNVCLVFWKERSGFEVDASGESFTMGLNATYPLPQGIELVVKDAI